jgi:hypothetical protein
MSAFRCLLAKTGLWQPKSARSAAHSAPNGSFRLFAVALGPHQRLKAFHIENHVFAIAKAFEDLHIFHSAQNSEWCLGGKRSPRRQRIRSSPPQYFRNSLGRCLADFANLSTHSPQKRRRRVRKKQSTIDCPTLYSVPCSVADRVPFWTGYRSDFSAKTRLDLALDPT